MSARRRNADQSLSPSSTSIQSHGRHSSSADDDSSSSSNSSQYDGLTEDQLYEIWSRRNLAYFDRRQRLLEEERQQQRDEDDSSSSDNSNEAQQQQLQQQLHQQPLPSTTAPTTTTTAASSSRGNSNNNLNNEWMSKNLMGEYNSHRAATEPSYHNSWMACQRLVNMYLSSSSSSAASTSNNNEGGESDYFVPMNPRLAELLECRRVEMARERYMAEVEQSDSRRQQEHHHHQQQQRLKQQRLKQQHCSNDNNGEALHTEGMDIDNDASDSAAAVARRQQVAEYERLSQAHRLQQQQHQRQQQQQQQQQQHQQQQQQQNKQRVAYYMALPNTTQQFTQSVICSQCNCTLYTTPIAQRFFCNICGCISDRQLLMVGGGEEEKMMDVED